MTYDDRQKFEHELIHRRITWLLTSQSILFAISALAPTNSFLKIVIAFLGIFVSTIIWFGILMGIRAKYLSYEIERDKREKETPEKKKQSEYESDPLQWGVNTEITRLAMMTDKLIPVVFFLAWLAILIWNLIFYTSSTC